MSDSWQEVKKINIAYGACLISLFLILLMIGIILLSWAKLPPQLPLWFSRPWGADRLSSPYWLLVLPGAGIVWLGLTLIFNAFLTHDHPIFTRTLFLVTAIINFLSALAVINIINLIT